MPAEQPFYVIEQRISAGNQFTGVAPSSSPTTSGGVRIYPEDASGGLFEFDFAPNNLLWVVERVLLKLNPAGTTYSLRVRNPDGSTDVEVAAGSGTDVYLGSVGLESLRMTGDEKLLLVTTGGTGALMARITARPEMQLPSTFSVG